MNKKKQLDYDFYITDCRVIPGKSFKVVEHIARRNFDKIRVKTKRTPYIRSAYFRKEKIFLTIFWSHLHQKHEKDKKRRLKYFDCGIDLLINSKKSPITTNNPDKKSEIFYRFIGKTKSGEIFVVQIKENKSNKKKYLISIYPKN